MVKITVPESEKEEIKKMLGIINEEVEHTKDFPRETAAYITRFFDQVIQHKDCDTPTRNFAISMQNLIDDKEASFTTVVKITAVLLIFEFSQQEMLKMLSSVDYARHQNILSMLELLLKDSIQSDMSKIDISA